VLSLLGVLPAAPSARAACAVDDAHELPGVARGELLCQAFEAFRLLLPSAQTSFEHAVFLATALARGDQLRLDNCGGCGGFAVIEPFRMRSPRCPYCAAAAHSRSSAIEPRSVPGKKRDLPG
jgi:hypothetical protein